MPSKLDEGPQNGKTKGPNGPWKVGSFQYLMYKIYLRKKKQIWPWKKSALNSLIRGVQWPLKFLTHFDPWLLCLHGFSDAQITVHYTHSNPNPNRSSMRFLSSLPLLYNIALFGPYSPLLCSYWFSEGQLVEHSILHTVLPFSFP